jgi:hypothetical protein
LIGELSPQVNNFGDSNTSISATQFEVSSVEDLSGVLSGDGILYDFSYFLTPALKVWSTCTLQSSAIKLHETL